MFPSYLKVEKLVHSYFEPDKHYCSYLERKKAKTFSSQLLGARKKIMTSI